ncbi:MAG: Rv3235 family protein [Propioniciclava sp.]
MPTPPLTFGALSRPAETALIPRWYDHDPNQPPLPTTPCTATQPAAEEPVSWAAKRQVTTLVVALIEAISGRRPLSQVIGLIHPALRRRMALLVRRHSGESLRLGSLRAQSPWPGTIEATARLASPYRSHALALHLEMRAGQWVVTALESAPIG